MGPAGEIPEKKAKRSMSLATLLTLLVLFVAALEVRLWTNSQSLWYDELYTAAFHVSRPWWDIVAHGPYSPNNHVLSTLLIKAVTSVTGVFTLVPGTNLPVMLARQNTVFIRMVSILAGSLLTLALAWKMRERWLAAVLLGCIALALPWLVASSTEARGYTLMLLLAAVATNCLWQFDKRFSWAYVAAMAGAIYTVPIAGEMLLGHAVAMMLLHRRGLKRWGVAVGVVLGVAGLLYLPVLGGIAHHIKTPEAGQAPLDIGAYLFVFGQHLATGWQSGSLWQVAIAGVVLVVGTAMAWRVRALRDLLVTFGIATGVAIGCALLVSNMRGTRLAIWAGPLMVLAVFGLVTGVATLAKRTVVVKLVAATLGAAALAAMAWADVQLATIEPQPVFQGLYYADKALARRSEHDANIVGVSLGSQESLLYWEKLSHDMDCVYDLEQLKKLEAKTSETWLVIFYEDLLKANRPQLAAYIDARYELRTRIPGRISPVAVYAPRPGVSPLGVGP